MTDFSTKGARQKYKEFDNLKVNETLEVDTLIVERDGTSGLVDENFDTRVKATTRGGTTTGVANATEAAVNPDDLVRKGEADADYVSKDGDKVLSDENYTASEKTKVSNTPTDTNQDLSDLDGRVGVNEVDIINLQDNQVTGVVTYQTYAELNAATKAIGVSYKVTNDPDTVLINPPSSNNGYYNWDGSVLTKDRDLTDGVVEEGNSDGVSGGTTYEYNAKTSSVYNVTSLHPLNGGYYDSRTARATVAENYKKNGLKISYQPFAGVTINEQFSGDADSDWGLDESWTKLGTYFAEGQVEVEGNLMSSIFTSEALEILGGVKKDGEIWLKYLMTNILNSDSVGIAETVLSGDEARDLMVWMDKALNVFGRIDNEGVWQLPLLTAAGLKFSEGVGTSTELLVGKDGDDNVIFWVDNEGIFHISQVESESLDKKIEDLRKDANYCMANISRIAQLGDRYLETQERNDELVLQEKGQWTRDAEISGTKKMYITISDDDSIDNYKKDGTTEEPYRGGYYSRLFPIAYRKGIPMNECHIGEITDRMPESRYLQDVQGWEILAHSLSHDYPAYNSTDTIEKYFKDSGTTEIADMYEADKYFAEQWDRDVWLNMGLNVKNAANFYSGSSTRRIRRAQKASGYKSAMSVLGFSGNEEWNTAPLSQFVIKRSLSLDQYTATSVTDYITRGTVDLNAQLDYLKSIVDDMVASDESSWLDLLTHAYRLYWCNYNADYDDPTYLEAWRVPVADQPTYAEFMAGSPFVDPNIPYDWEPAPDTALKVLWDFIDYAQSQGVEFVTVDKAVSRFGNALDAGDFTYGKRKADFEPLVSPHYVVGNNGSASYYND